MTEKDAPVRLVSPHDPRKVVEILRREVDSPPSFLRCALTLNAHYFHGTSSVCGVVSEQGFELRCRNGPGFSIRAQGTLKPVEQGTEIQMHFSGPRFPDVLGLLLGDYRDDRKRILGFLMTHLHAHGRDGPTA
jgi:hypothetical protein